MFGNSRPVTRAIARLVFPGVARITSKSKPNSLLYSQISSTAVLYESKKASLSTLVADIQRRLSDNQFILNGRRMQDICNILQEDQISEKLIYTSFARQPQLTKYSASSWTKALATLKDYGFQKDQLLLIITSCPEILSGKMSTLLKTTEILRGIGFSDSQLLGMVSKNLKLISTKDALILENFNTLMSLFPKHKCKTACHKHPEILTLPASFIEERVRYCVEEMGLELDDAFKASVFIYSPRRIRQRHLFLERAGLFQKPDKHGATTIEIPKLKDIVADSDERFAGRVAKMSVEEYRVFGGMLEAEEYEDTSSDDDEETSSEEDSGFDSDTESDAEDIDDDDNDNEDSDVGETKRLR